MNHYQPKPLADILQGIPPAAHTAPSAAAPRRRLPSGTALPAAAARTAPIVFGAPDDALSITRGKAQDVIAAVNAEWQKQRNIAGVAKAAAAAGSCIRQDKTLMDFALGASLDICPWRRPNGENIFYDQEGNGYKVRSIRKTGDVWVDFKAATDKSGKWQWHYFQRGAIITIASFNPMLARLNAGKTEDLHAIILWFVLLAQKLNRQQKPCAPSGGVKKADVAGMIGGRRVYSRLAHLRLASKHSALSVQTRILLAFIWCGGNGYLSGRKLHIVAKMTARAAGLPEDPRFLQRRVLRVLALCQNEVWDALTAKKMTFADFNEWRGRVVARLADGGHAAEFRLFMILWHFCLTHDKGAWRWRGWHKITAFAVRAHSHAARRMSGHARCHKTTARRALAIFSVSGLFSFATGAMVCVTPGYWGAALMQRISKIASFLSLTRRIGHHQKLIGNLAASPQAP